MNGARGVVVKFTWPNGESDQPETGALPQNVLIKFHDPRVGRINRVYLNEDNGQYIEAVHIEPVTAKFFGRRCWNVLNCHSFLSTIHKVQGLSLDAAVSPKVFEDGMAYVALSIV